MFPGLAPKTGTISKVQMYQRMRTILEKQQKLSDHEIRALSEYAFGAIKHSDSGIFSILSELNVDVHQPEVSLRATRSLSRILGRSFHTEKEKDTGGGLCRQPSHESGVSTPSNSSKSLRASLTQTIHDGKEIEFDQFISSSMHLDPVPLPLFVDLFDRHRKLGFFEQLFMPRSIKRTLTGREISEELQDHNINAVNAVAEASDESDSCASGDGAVASSLKALECADNFKTLQKHTARVLADLYEKQQQVQAQIDAALAGLADSTNGIQKLSRDGSVPTMAPRDESQTGIALAACPSTNLQKLSQDRVVPTIVRLRDEPVLPRNEPVSPMMSPRSAMSSRSAMSPRSAGFLNAFLNDFDVEDSKYGDMENSI